eukprot:TCALIF_00118-PA protein Name:"Similar to faxc Failed axon connections homolog (Xenopus tropicalis)" AED:0.20 eAED:0.20 QI:0/0/0/0.66/1/1/3/0/323
MMLEKMNGFQSQPRTILLSIGIAGCGTVAVLSLFQYLRGQSRWKHAQAQWAQEDPDVVILHQFPRPKACLSASPFPIKLETYLRIAEIKYINDFEFPYHPQTHKSPWITINGEHFADSQLCIETLNRKFNKDLGYMNQQGRYLDQVYSWVDSQSVLSRIQFEFYRRRAVKKLTNQALGQGLARCGPGDVQKMGIADLEAISALLGSKSFVMGGEKPSVLDCTLFGFVACVLYTCQENSTYKSLIEKRLTNLNQHCLRMKAKHFPDWNTLINGPSELKAPTTEKTSDENGSHVDNGKGNSANNKPIVTASRPPIPSGLVGGAKK